MVRPARPRDTPRFRPAGTPRILTRAMAELLVETPEGITLRYEIAGPGTRTAAGLIDLAIFVTIWLALLLILFFASEADVSGVTGFLIGLLVGGGVVLPAVFQIAFGEGELRRFLRLPGDLDGDGRLDFVQVDAKKVELRYSDGDRGYPKSRATTIELGARIDGFLGIRFADLDDDGRKELLAFLEREAEQGDVGEPRLLEVHRLEEGR